MDQIIMGRLLDQIKAVNTNYPTLQLDEKSFTLSGRLDVDDHDHFFVEIDCRPWGLRRFPRVKETGGRIPPKAHRHIYTNTLTCCLTTRFMEEILVRTEINTLEDFFREVLIPYFLRQIYYEVHGEYDEELDHDTLGLLQSYGEVLGIQDPNILIPLMEDRVNGCRIGRNEPCYCGKGKLKKCKHRSGYELFRLVPIEVITADLKLFKNYN